MGAADAQQMMMGKGTPTDSDWLIGGWNKAEGRQRHKGSNRVEWGRAGDAMDMKGWHLAWATWARCNPLL